MINPLEYLFAREVECPEAFWAEDACAYALMGIRWHEGYIPAYDHARILLSFPRALPVDLKGIAV